MNIGYLMVMVLMFFCGSSHFRLVQSDDSSFSFLLSAYTAYVSFFPKEQFKKNHPMSAIKESTLDEVENITLPGLIRPLTFYPDTGGDGQAERRTETIN